MSGSFGLDTSFVLVNREAEGNPTTPRTPDVFHAETQVPSARLPPKSNRVLKLLMLAAILRIAMIMFQGRRLLLRTIGQAKALAGSSGSMGVISSMLLGEFVTLGA